MSIAPELGNRDQDTASRSEPLMTVVVILVLALLGGTTWLAQNQPLAKNATLNRKLTAIGLVLCAATFAVVGLAIALTWP